MTATPRINVTYSDESIIDTIEQAAEVSGMSRSAFIIEAAHQTALKTLREHEGANYCEICGTPIKRYKSWSKCAAHQLGVVLCHGCHKGVESLPEDAAIRALIKKPTRSRGRK